MDAGSRGLPPTSQSSHKVRRALAGQIYNSTYLADPAKTLPVSSISSLSPSVFRFHLHIPVAPLTCQSVL